MTTESRYEVRPEAVRGVVGNVFGTLMQLLGTVVELEQMELPPAAYGAIGAPVASASGAMRTQLIQTLRSLLSVLQETNELAQRSASDYEAADVSVAQSFGGGARESVAVNPSAVPDGIAVPDAGGLGGQLARLVVADSAGLRAEPHSVGNVVDYLTDAGLGQLRHEPLTDVTFADATAFADWLDADPAHQERAGLIGVYSAEMTRREELAGVVQQGDVVVGQPLPAFGDAAVVAVTGGDGQLYNHGPVDAAPWLSRVRVYRPIGEASSLW